MQPLFIQGIGFRGEGLAAIGKRDRPKQAAPQPLT
jgi:hypothetical protein